ncbi:MAG: ABC-F family ATP-binding cassette domain-containing protein [Syntrophomonadaceae bacterium]|nr:ABC-F family ATP-binding cassette domain-containing protein [Syntrophomonadaceae bacterium]MDD3889938.1 ABC-F family ATP-binding cassette domain-containing protein [Syntrophomonadaceae bacterium]MDD4550167.1 ABC-F family ATP-binding cassette domain-containing protein [Syntrophomonadaceae bacterium]
MLISCRKIKKSFGDRIVLNGIDLDICRGDRIGLVGRNGTGKSTLADILTGYLNYDEGNIITTSQELNIGYLRQYQNQADLLIHMMNNKAGASGEFQRLASHLGINRVWDWSGERLQNLSGGEKTKIALARVWTSQPDLVILDEPTNHMDYQGVNFLIAKLADYGGAAIIISHDRYFLDRTVSKIAEIEKGRLNLYLGNYSWYREARQKDRESRRHAYESQQKQQQEIETSIAQLKGWSDKAHRESRKKGEGIGGKEYYRKKAQKRDRSIKSHIKRLEKMRQEEIERPESELKVRFNFNARGKGGRRLLEATGISKTYGELILFEDSSFYVKRRERIGLLGPNGCGKTTLIRSILGKESLDSGEIFLSQGAQLAYVGQELPRDENGNLKEMVRDRTMEEQKRIFQLLIHLGIAYDRLEINFENLSWGERMKIAIGMAIMGEYDLLILDEPTNHLDLYSRESLEESLIQFPGSILLVSHDRYLLEKVCDHMLIFNEYKINRVEASPADYLSKKNVSAQLGLEQKNDEEEKLLLDTQISRVISQLSLHKQDHPKYTELDQEYKELIQRKNSLK